MFIPAILAATALAMVAEVGPGKAVEKLQVIPTSPRCRPKPARNLQAANRIVTRLEKRRPEGAMEEVEGVLLLCRLDERVVVIVSLFSNSSHFGSQTTRLRQYIWRGIEAGNTCRSLDL